MFTAVGKAQVLGVPMGGHRIQAQNGIQDHHNHTLRHQLFTHVNERHRGSDLHRGAIGEYLALSPPLDKPPLPVLTNKLFDT